MRLSELWWLHVRWTQSPARSVSQQMWMKAEEAGDIYLSKSVTESEVIEESEAIEESELRPVLAVGEVIELSEMSAVGEMSDLTAVDEGRQMHLGVNLVVRCVSRVALVCKMSTSAFGELSEVSELETN
eukprot:GHVN01086986.1.p1 GENE.GHVN01086986.1~~GHVN01086986.1.p1  ORF type:complete len:129 (-),score=55.21 GHVN01086986.1:175-561(-)